ncbi:ABC transporter substrate-binding protein [Peptostreptococcus faecalis]|uniref:ABC transporter substrate-binding protein n=1 Tax=Peptostreptococcus faecalis TaxID=2045015 RepID=UPI000C7BBBC3|nr:ABC transporter substrate-binding protein [Peptostreptococcus faecalis]
MNKYFSVEDKIYDMVNKNPKAIDFLISNGFEHFSDKDIFEKMSKNISLSMALKLKKINVDLYEERLVSYLEESTSSVDTTLIEKKENKNADVNIQGVLPCPIRIPLLENFESWLENNKNNFDTTISYNLKSANRGLDWIKEQVKTGNVDDVPDVVISAGFDLFFDKELMGQYLDKDIFEVKRSDINSDFCNENIDLRDPQNKYSIIGVVPAVFLVNKNELNGRKMPETWADILSEEFSNSVAIPMGDLDLFNAILVNIHREYGDEGISNLARSYMKNLHPAQMVKSQLLKKNMNPAVSIIPYFFTQMSQGENVEAVWPKDGAIMSPIFLMSKKGKTSQVVDFFMSTEVGKIFSANGKFPSTNKNVENYLSKDKKFKWVGWDFIHNTDIGSLLRTLEENFNKEIVD